MYLLVMQFEVPNNKLYEFNLALGRLVKWPVYVLHSTESNAEKRKFELMREWDNEADMREELKSAAYENLTGMIKVLGQITLSKIYHVPEQTDLLVE